MFSFRVLAPFFILVGACVLALVLGLMLLGHSSDERAQERLQQQLAFALQDRQRQLASLVDQAAILHEHLDQADLQEALAQQLEGECLLVIQEGQPIRDYLCTQSQALSTWLAGARARLQPSSLVQIEERVYLYHWQQVEDKTFLLLDELNPERLAQWQRIYTLPPLELTSQPDQASETGQFPLQTADGQTLAYLHFVLPRPGQSLVRTALFPALIVLLFLANLGLFAAYKLSHLIRERELSEQRLRQVIDLVPQMIYARDQRGYFVLANQATARFYQRQPDELLGHNLVEITGDSQLYEQQLIREKALLASGGSIFMEEECLPQGEAESERVLETSKLQFTDTQGHPAILSVSQDVTRQRSQQQQLHLLSSALEHSGSAVLICDAQDRIRYTNTRLCELLGQSQEQLDQQHLEKLLRANVSREQRYRLIRGLREKGYWRGELQLNISAAQQYWLLVSISPIHFQQQQEAFFVLVAEDITALKQTHQKMERLALYDTLTGLENRRLFKQRLHKGIKLARRQGNLVALVYLDLDHFKRINDTLGHDAGDQLLITVAERLRACVRESDSIARLGGDEFTLLLHDLTSADAAASVARKVIEALSQPIDLEGSHVLVTTSVGIALAPSDTHQPNELLKHADLAMYQAKSLGRNNYQFFSQEMNAKASRFLEVETQLRLALAERSFQVYYQPQFDLRLGQVVGFEALVRWQHPERGLISPAEFIPIAEETGLILQLGQQVLEQACQDMAWFSQHFGPACYVAVNLSTQQLKDKDLAQQLSRLLTDYQVSPKQLELEITESALMDQMDLSLPILYQLQELGIHLSIDDFGTGYSSLSYLKQLPVHSLKIDRSFVKDIQFDANDRAIISAVAAMASKLNLEVIAEGVEESQQLDWLQAAGCHLVQGYYFSPPLPLDQLVAACEQLERNL